MRRSASGLALAVALAASQPALACRPPVYSEAFVAYPRTDFAVVMVENAAYVDLAIAERAEPIPELADWVRAARSAAVAEDLADGGEAWALDTYRGLEADLRRRGAARIVFRSLEKLKGEGPSWFTLNGFWKPRDRRRPGIGSRLSEALSPRAVYSTIGGPYELGRDRLIPLCGAGLTVWPGQQYLVFRDASGRLLADGIPYLLTADSSLHSSSGYVFEAVAAEGDPWLSLVREAASRRH